MQGSKSVKYRYLDASALVKLHIDEEASGIVRAFVNDHPKPFQTASLCFAEALNVFKRKGEKKELPDEAYFKATWKLITSVWGRDIEIQEYGMTDPFVHRDVEQIAKRNPGIDCADALQLVTLLKGRHSFLINESRSVLITGDKQLALAAEKEGIRVWYCMTGEVPPWVQTATFPVGWAKAERGTARADPITACANCHRMVNGREAMIVGKLKKAMTGRWPDQA